MNTKKVKSYLICFIASAILIAIDQISKYAAVFKLKDQASFPIINNIFELHYLENKGAAFGLLQGKKAFFLIITILFLIALIWFYGRIPSTRHFLFLRIIAVMLFAGAIGNMIDRIIHNYVIDFFYFKLIDFPIFNVADIYVTVSLILLIILIFFYYKEEDLNMIFPDKKEKNTSL